VTVDDRLRTSDPSVLALGEIAEWVGRSWGITPAAEHQARVAARAVAGDPFALYSGSVSVNVLKVGGVDLASAGTLVSDHPRKEEVVFVDEAQRTYKKVVIEADRVVGVLFLGDKTEFPGFRDLIESGRELGEARASLLRSGSAPREGTGKLVCSCLSVRASVIEEAVGAGCASVADLMAKTGAGTGCGSCRPELAAFLKAREAVHG
jgi:ferredoxin-nitrate reductase